MRKAITQNDLAPFKKTFEIAGVALERYAVTEAELESIGLPAQPRSHTFEEEWHEQALEAIADGDVVLVHGPAGTGKDYTAEAIAYHMGMPLVCLSIKPDLDPNDWVGTTRLRGDGVGGTESLEQEGFVADACRGFEIERDGRKELLPAFILISDFDRASARQIEVFRQAFEGDGTDGRRYLTHPLTGARIQIAEGTRFYLTANSAADGDGGRGMVTSQLDASILNRCSGVYAGTPSASFERKLVSGFAPDLDKSQVALVVKCLRAVRSAVQDQGITLEISARTAKMVVKRLRRRLKRGEAFEPALNASFSVVKGMLSEKDNRMVIEGALDPFVGSSAITAASATN